jgi:hypothetical protein
MATPDEDWFERARREEERDRQYSDALVVYLVPALRFLGVLTASIQYDGYGDDGEFEPVVYEGAPEAGVPEGLDGEIEEACERALPRGWEINEGSYGTWWIDVRAGNANLNHEYNDEEEEDEDEGE